MLKLFQRTLGLVPSRTRSLRRAKLSLESLGDRIVPAGVMTVGTDAGTIATVRTYVDSDGNGAYDKLAGEFQPFGGATSGVRVAMGDFDGDGNQELATAMGGGQSRVKVWTMNTDGTVGNLIDSFRPFNANVGGVFVAAGDLDNDGRDELAVSWGANGTRIHIYSDTDHNGLLSDNLVDTFSPFAQNFSGGSRIAFGNIDGTGGDELIVARGPGGTTVVKVYSDTNADRAVSDNPVVETFQPFGPTYTGGAFVASGALAGAGGNGAEVIVGRETGAGQVRIFSDANSNGRVGDDPVFDHFRASGSSSSGGVRVAAGDTDGKGGTSVITASGPGGNQVSIRKDGGDGDALPSNDAVADRFSAFGSGYTGGLFVAFGEVKSFSVISPHLPIDILNGTTVTSTINIAPGAGIISDLDLSLSIAQPLIGDLTITLTHVSSDTTVTLFSGLSLLGNALMVRLDDSATTDILDAIPNVLGGAVSGVYHLAGSALLSAFDGLDASGDWLLSITDSGLGGGGTLLGWSLFGQS